VPPVRRDGIRVLDLSEDLRFAHDQRVEPRRDTKQVPRDVGAGVDVEMRREVVLGHIVEPAHEPLQAGSRGLAVLAGDVDLGAVAGRQHHGLSRRRTRGQLPQRLAHATPREIDPLAQIDRRRVVAHAQQQEIHRAWCSLDAGEALQRLLSPDS